MKRLILAAALLLPLPALAQVAPPPDAAFVSEWSSLDSSINAAALQRQHVVEAAKTLIGDWSKQKTELAYWHRWIEGEKAGWEKTAKAAPPPGRAAGPGEVKP
jgi:hypothetical protein